jgi:hypothetical protein
MNRSCCVLLGLGFCVMPLAPADGADPAAGRTVIRQIKGFQPPRTGQLMGFVRTKPSVMESDEQVVEVLGQQEAARVMEQVDLDTEYLLLFQWAGSGQDKLTYKVKQRDRVATVAFSFQPGRTRDLRRHAYLYAIQRGVQWQILK